MSTAQGSRFFKISEAATESSKVLLTPRTLTDRTLTVTDVQNGKFRVEVKQADTQDISRACELSL